MQRPPFSRAASFFGISLEYFLLKFESFLHLIDVIEFLPGEKFNLKLDLIRLAFIENLLNNFGLASHVPISCRFRINRRPQVEALLDKIRTHIEYLLNFAADFTVSHVNLGSSVSGYV